MDKRIMASIVGVLLVGIVLGYFARQPEIRNLQNQVNSLSEEATQKDSEIQLLQQQVQNLNQSYAELSEKYEDLLFHYNLLNGPASNFTTIQDLQITLTTHQTTYYYMDSVSGNVTITYLNRTPFEGEFRLSIFLVNGGGVSGIPFDIRNGFAEFSYGPPAFTYGPGTYSIKISWIYTIDGFVAADPNDAGLPEVLVEAN